jgi:hypothetical protein
MSELRVDHCPACMAPLSLTPKSDTDYVVTCPHCMADVHAQPEQITFRFGSPPADKPRLGHSHG